MHFILSFLFSESKQGGFNALYSELHYQTPTDRKHGPLMQSHDYEACHDEHEKSFSLVLSCPARYPLASERAEWHVSISPGLSLPPLSPLD